MMGLVDSYLKTMERFSFEVSFGASAAEKEAVRQALKQWAKGKTKIHEAWWEEQISSGGAVYEKDGELYSGFYEYTRSEIPRTESGYQDASPGPHAREVAERGNRL